MSSTTAQAAKNPKSKEKNDLSKPRQTATSQKRQLRSHEKRETNEQARTATTPTQQKKNTSGRELSQQEISVSPFNPGEDDGETTKKLRSICREFNIDTPEDLRGMLKKLYTDKDGRETIETRQSNGDTPKGATKDKKNEILSKANDHQRRKEIESREIKIQELQQQLIDKDKHLSDIQLKLEKSEKEIKDLKEQKREISVLKQQLDEEKRSKEALEGQMKIQSDNEHAKSELITVQMKIKDLESEVQKSKNDIEQGKSELASAQTRIKDLEIEVQKSKKEAEKNLKPDTKKLKEEIDQLKNRLSQLAGSKLTEGNPAIADLSDMNRPINLGEKFSELYDNQWTDAFEVLQDSGKRDEEVIKELVEILEDAYTFCKEQSQDFHENLRKLMQPFGMKQEALPTEVSKQIKDHRKNLSVSMVQNIQERFCKERQITDESKLKTYAKQCAGLCWFMMVQDPPLFMDTTLPKKNKFDSDKFRAYTKTGKRIDFLVWPALYLHAEGPLLSKGVAQGK